MKFFCYKALLIIIISIAIGLTTLVWAFDTGTTQKSVSSDKRPPIISILSLLLGNPKEIANNDGTYLVDEDQTLNISAPGVLANDENSTGSIVVLVQDAKNGNVSLNISGSFTYTPKDDYWGPDNFTYKINKGSSSSNVATASIYVKPINDPPVANAGQDDSVLINEPIILDGNGSTDPENDLLTYNWSLTDKPSGSLAILIGADTSTPSFTPDNEGTYTIELVVNDGNLTSTPNNVTIIANPLPPDPATVAPAINPTMVTTTYGATEFLYTGENPIQAGVEQGTIEPDLIAVIRGKVLARDGSPLSGVSVTILNHPEFGQTYSRDDGMFDLVVNGGQTVVVEYSKSGYLTLQRSLDAPVLDFTIIPDVVMTMLDAQTTTVELTQTVEDFIVAEGSVTSDERGTRKSTLLFPEGTQAELKFDDGSTQPINTLTVRMTEYSTGEDGPDAMPAQLPRGIGYTYCVEMSVDEAANAGAKTVTFDTPLINYVENFLGFAVGEPVPSYYYDRVAGLWVLTTDGIVIKIISISSGKADLDTDGDSAIENAATLTALGLTESEREYLAALYPVGTELWRVPIDHFSPRDHNWPIEFEDDADDPILDLEQVEVDSACEVTGSSLVKCQSQVLGESIPVAGTEMNLNYRSNRTEGDTRNYTKSIKLTDDTVPSSLQYIKLTVNIAGQSMEEVYTELTPNMVYSFTWDGKDGYGRDIYGSQVLTVDLVYMYLAYYATSDPFSYPTVAPKEAQWRGVISVNPPVPLGVQGWSLDKHHFYDLGSETLYLGTGEDQKVDFLSGIITTVAGNRSTGYNGDNIKATDASLWYPWGASVAPNGDLYICDTSNNRIRKVDTAGIITTVAGTGVRGFSGDGGPATDASLSVPSSVEVAPDGSIYISDYGNGRIRKVGHDGIITTVVGGGDDWVIWDLIVDKSLPATDLSLDRRTRSISFAADGSYYVVMEYDGIILKIDTSGIATIAAGGGDTYYTGEGEGLLATEADLAHITDIAAAPDGSFYFAYGDEAVVVKVDPVGILSTVAGTANGVRGYSGDGGPATEALLQYPMGVEIAPDGTLYISDSDNYTVRKVDPDGIITTIAGTGEIDGYSGDGGPATEARLDFPNEASIAPDGDLYIIDTGNHVIRKVELSYQKGASSIYTLPSSEGEEVFQFDGHGRHLQTLDAMSGATLYAFTYDDDGLLTELVDRNGNIIAVEHNGDGTPSAIIGPYGQRTEMNFDANGFLSGISNPIGEIWALENSSGGLLTSAVTPNSHLSTYDYDADGGLIKATDSAGGFQALQRTEIDNGYELTRTTQMGRSTSYRVENLENNVQRLLNIPPDGLAMEALVNTDGGQTINWPHGITINTDVKPDPRFGMLAPYVSSVDLTTPGGRSFSMTRLKSASLADTSDPFSLQSLTETTVINGRSFESIYETEGNTRNSTSPEGRSRVKTYNSLGQLISSSVTGITSTGLVYDTDGRIEAINQGAREFTIIYGSNGYQSALTDPLGRTVSYTRDGVGRITTKSFGDGREISFAYDNMGNLTVISPPGRPLHGFSYSSVDKLNSYTSALTASTLFSYNNDRQLTQVQKLGVSLNLAYDTAGRISTLTTPSKTVTYGYDGTTGQLTSLGNGTETLVYNYDGILPTGVSWGGSVSGSVDQEYNDDFQVVSRDVNNANRVAFTYDLDGLLIQAGSLILTRSADNGLITGTELGGVVDSRSYNAFAEFSGYNVAYNTSEIYATTFVHDDLGRIIQKIETIQGEEHTYDYEYDAVGRLVSVDNDSVEVEVYTYDNNGNRLTANGTNAVYDNDDKLVTLGSITYTYNNGDMQSKTEGSDVTTYSYDFFGNLTQVVLPDATQIDYVIDAANRRVGKKLDGLLVRCFLYKDSLNPVAELNGSGAIISRFVYGSKKSVPDYMVKGGNIYRIISDYLGSPRLVVDTASGTVAQRLDYDSFGNVTGDSAPGFQPFGFAGGIYDPDTGLTRFGARDYDAQSGRWTAKDPILFNGGDSNLYAYVMSDPINFVDPTGLRSSTINSIIDAVTSAYNSLVDLYETATGLVDSAVSVGEDVVELEAISDNGRSSDDPRNLLDIIDICVDRLGDFLPFDYGLVDGVHIATDAVETIGSDEFRERDNSILRQIDIDGDNSL